MSDYECIHAHTVYKIRNKLLCRYWSKTHGWIDDLSYGEPYRTKKFAYNAAKRILKMPGNTLLDMHITIVEYKLEEVDALSMKYLNNKSKKKIG